MSALFENHPLISVLFFVWAFGIAACIALVLMAIAGGLFNSWRQSCAGRPEQKTSKWEYNMRKRFGLLSALIVAFTLVGYMTGCSTWGNGKLDVEAEVVWQSNLGHEYRVIANDAGLKLYASNKGDLYEPTDSGGFVIQAPDGKGGTVKTRIQRVVPPDKATPDGDTMNPETSAAIAHAQAAIG